MTVAAESIPMVEKQGLRSSGAWWSPSRRARVNSFSKAARSSMPVSRPRSIIRLRKLRGHAPHGSPSRVTRSHRSRADLGTYGRTANVPGSGMSRISPTGPNEPSGASWSSMLNDCIATVSPIPEVR